MALKTLPSRPRSAVRRKKRGGPVPTGADVPHIDPIQDPGLTAVEGAFGGQEAQAVSEFGNALSEAHNVLQVNARRQAKLDAKNQALIDKQIVVLDKNRTSQLKLLIDSYAARQSEAIKTRPVIDSQGVEIDQQSWSKKNAQKFIKDRYSTMFGRLVLPIHREEIENYLSNKLLGLSADATMRTRVGRIKTARGTLALQERDLKNYISQHPDFEESELESAGVVERTQAIQDQVETMIGAGIMNSEEAENFNLRIGDEVGQIQIDRRSELLTQFSSKDSVQKLIRDIRGGRYGISPGKIKSNIENILKASSSFFDDQETEFDELTKVVNDKMLSQFYLKPTLKDFSALTDQVSEPAFNKDGNRILDQKSNPAFVKGSAFITDPREVQRMQKALEGVVDEKSEKNTDFLLIEIENRGPFTGPNLEGEVQFYKEEVQDQWRRGEITSSDFERVTRAIATWEKESETELGKRLSIDKRNMGVAIKTFIEPKVLFAVFGGNLDIAKVNMIQDLIRLGHARLDRAFKNRNDGKDFSSFQFILDDIRTRIADGGRDFLFSDEIISNLSEKLAEGVNLTDVEAEQVLLLNRLNRLKKKRRKR